MDAAGHVAFFAAGVGGAVPTDADVTRTGEAIEALVRAAQARDAGAGYRAAGERPNEPVFDAPSSSEGGAMHERTIDGYPHLVVAEHADDLRRWLAGREDVREVLVTRGLGVVLADLYEDEHEQLHEREICSGCRATDPWSDPRPRAPAAIAAAGLYAFAHTGGDDRCPYVRVASPSVPARVAGVEAIVGRLAERVPLPLRFAAHETLSPWRFVGCR